MGTTVRSLIALAFSLAAACASAASANAEIRIGMSAPFSGTAEGYGRAMRDTMQLVFDQVNKDGGINGQPVRLISRDDGYEVARAAENTRLLVQEDKVFALAGYYGSSSTIGILPLLEESKIPLVGTISGASPLFAPGSKYLFNVRASYWQETQNIVRQIGTLSMRRIAVVYQDDAFGQDGLEGVKRAVSGTQMNVVATATIARNQEDASEAVKTIVAAKPDAVIIVLLHRPAVSFIRGMHKAAVYPLFAALSPISPESLAKELGPLARGVAINQVMPYPQNDAVPLVREYRKLIAANPALSPSYYGLEGFVIARTVVDALKKSGSPVAREKFITSMERKSDLGGFELAFTQTSRAGSKFTELTVIGANGRILR